MQALPTHITWILDRLHQHHYEAFLVGGCVRDMLMNRAIHDYDITTSAKPEELLQVFKGTPCKLIPTGIKHGTITILINQETVEVTTYRIEESYIQHRKPSSVTFTNNLLEDLKRRDFTMNAIAYDPIIGYIDPFSGRDDIKNRIIRCVGDAKERLSEDALRILRAIRFSFTLDFTLDSNCLLAIHALAPSLTHISKERIRSEFDKILLADHPHTLALLRSYGVLDQLFPGYSCIYEHPQPTPWHLYDIFTHTDVALTHTKAYPLESKLAIVFHDIGKPSKESFDAQGIAHYKQHALVSEKLARAYLKQLHYDNKTIDTVCTYILYHDYYVLPKRAVLRRFLSKFQNNVETALQVLDVQKADDLAKNPEKATEKVENIALCKAMILQMEAEKDMFSLKDLAINGHDLLSLGYQGKQIKDALQACYDLVLEQPSNNTKEALLRFLQSHT